MKLPDWTLTQKIGSVVFEKSRENSKKRSKFWNFDTFERSIFFYLQKSQSILMQIAVQQPVVSFTLATSKLEALSKKFPNNGEELKSWTIPIIFAFCV